MKNENKTFVRNCMTQFFLLVSDLSDATKLTNAIINDVVKDIEETADAEFNSSDVDMAITRVLKQKLNIEG